MKLIVFIVKHSNSVNLKNQFKIAIVKRMKLRNTVGKKITTLAGIKSKLLIGKETLREKCPNTELFLVRILAKAKKLYIL